MNFSTRTLGVLWLVLSSISGGAATAAVPDHISTKQSRNNITITFGSIADDFLQDGDSKWAETYAYLQNRLPEYNIRTKDLQWEEIDKAIRQKEVQFFMANPSMFAKLSSTFGMRPLVSLLEEFRGNYFGRSGSVILRHVNDRTIRKLSDLRGKKFAAVNESSFFGWYLAKNEIINSGLSLDSFFSSLTFMDSHEDIVLAVFNKEVDAGTVRSGIIENMQNIGALPLESVTVFHQNFDYPQYPFQLSTDLYPGWAMVATADVSEKIIHDVMVQLLAITPEEKAAVSGQYYGWNALQDYSSADQVLQNVRAPPYQNYGVITWRELLRQYFLHILAAISMVVILIVATVRLKRLNTKLHEVSNHHKEAHRREKLSSEKLEITQALVKEQNTTLTSALKELQASQKQIISQEKLAYLGKLTAGIAHEISNPLNIIINYASLTQELIKEFQDLALKAKLHPISSKEESILQEVTEDICSNSRKTFEQGKHAREIVQNILENSEGYVGNFELSDINTILTESVRLAFHSMRSSANEFDLQIDYQLAENLPQLSLVPSNISKVFVNVVNNAIYAMGKKLVSAKEGYTPILTVRSVQGEDGLISVAIRDNGIGMNKPTVGQIFKPFFSTKTNPEGGGLGLSTAYDIIHNIHKGSIEVATEQGVFSEFSIHFLAQSAGNA